MFNSSPTIFVVDDDSDVLTSFKLILEQEHFTVHGFTHGNTVLDAMESIRPDAIVVDINLSGNSGLWVAEKVQALHGNQPVLVAITGDNRRTVQKACLQSGFDMFFTKPIRFKSFCENLRLVLAAKNVPGLSDNQNPIDKSESHPPESERTDERPTLLP
jgi:DNA-binding response OmpR family regulator